jgi:hypothetical protein
MQKYGKKIEEKMKLLYDNLSEKDKRYYAAVEAMKLGHGGIKYLANLFKCTRQTITKGLQGLEENKEIVKAGRSRRLGGGRKGYEAKYSNIDDIFLKVIDGHIAGDPMNEEIRWINLTLQGIANRMKKEEITISRNIVKKLLKKHKFVKRKMLGKISSGNFDERNQQFDIIQAQLEQFKDSLNPVVSMDTKKKRIFRTALSTWKGLLHKGYRSLRPYKRLSH